jgi:hypothetical protein
MTRAAWIGLIACVAVFGVAFAIGRAGSDANAGGASVGPAPTPVVAESTAAAPEVAKLGSVRHDIPTLKRTPTPEPTAPPAGPDQEPQGPVVTQPPGGGESSRPPDDEFGTSPVRP